MQVWTSKLIREIVTSFQVRNLLQHLVDSVPPLEHLLHVWHPPQPVKHTFGTSSFAWSWCCSWMTRAHETVCENLHSRWSSTHFLWKFRIVQPQLFNFGLLLGNNPIQHFLSNSSKKTFLVLTTPERYCFFRYTRYFNNISIWCNISRYFHDIFQM